MPDLLGKLRRLWPCSSADRIAALETTLAVCPAEETSVIVGCLMAQADSGRNARVRVMAAVRRQWGRLSDDARTLVRRRSRAAWVEALRSMLAGRDEQRRAEAIAMIATMPLPELAAELSPLLGVEGSPSVVEVAPAIRRLIEFPELTAAERVDVAKGVAAAVAGFAAHGREETIGLVPGLLASGDCSACLARELDPWLSLEDDPGHMVLRGVLRRSPGVDARLAAWVLLSRPVVQGAAMERLAQPADIREHRGVWSRIHLLGNPRRVVALRRGAGVRGRGRGEPLTNGDERALPPHERRGAVKWLAATTSDPAAQERLLGARIGDPDASVRHALLRAAEGVRTRLSVVQDLCFDADPRVARSAALVLVARGERTSGTLPAVLRRSPHPQVRGLAVQVQDRGPQGFTPAELKRFIQFGSPAAGDSLANLNAAAASVRRERSTGEGLSAQVQQHVESGDAAVRAAAARLLILSGGEERDRGRRVLVALLEDPRAEHRLAGLMLAERMVPYLGPAPDLVDHVASICRTSTDEAERTSAERVAKRLLTEIRHGWQRRAQVVEPEVQLAGADT